MDTTYLHLVKHAALRAAACTALAAIANPQHFAPACKGFALAYSRTGKPCHPLKAHSFTLVGALRLGMLTHKVDAVTWCYVWDYLAVATGQNLTADGVVLTHAQAVAALQALLAVLPQ